MGQNCTQQEKRSLDLKGKKRQRKSKANSDSAWFSPAPTGFSCETTTKHPDEDSYAKADEQGHLLSSTPPPHASPSWVIAKGAVIKHEWKKLLMEKRAQPSPVKTAGLVAGYVVAHSKVTLFRWSLLNPVGDYTKVVSIFQAFRNQKQCLLSG